MDIHGLTHQMKDHTLAIISVIIAIIALSYNTWRDEETEKNRSYRQAAFEVLKNLGELQIGVNYMHYDPKNPMANPFIAWGHIALVSDLSQLLPKPVPENIKQLVDLWKANADKIRTDEEAAEKVSQAIDESRKTVLHSIAHLR
jgi:hypothetical protein